MDKDEDADAVNDAALGAAAAAAAAVDDDGTLLVFTLGKRNGNNSKNKTAMNERMNV